MHSGICPGGMRPASAGEPNAICLSHPQPDHHGALSKPADADRLAVDELNGERTASLAPSATITPTAPDCTNLAQFVSETIPDWTHIAPGTAFIKTWTLKNIGTCTWGKGYALAFDHGDQMGAPASVPFTASVPPNAIYIFSVNLTAPSAGGVYQGFWKIQTPQGLRFGIEPNGSEFIWVKITVTRPHLHSAGPAAGRKRNARRGILHHQPAQDRRCAFRLG